MKYILNVFFLLDKVCHFAVSMFISIVWCSYSMWSTTLPPNILKMLNKPLVSAIQSVWLAWLHPLCCRDTSRLQLDARLHSESNIERGVQQRAVGYIISHEDDDEKIMTMTWQSCTSTLHRLLAFCQCTHKWHWGDEAHLQLMLALGYRAPCLTVCTSDSDSRP